MACVATTEVQDIKVIRSAQMTITKPQSQADPAPRSEVTPNSPAIRAVDAFCGIGGLTHGLRAVGIDVALGIDIDSSCRYAYEANNFGATFREADIREISFTDLEPYYEESAFTALVGCAPCQPFSAHTRRTATVDDCELVGEFSRLIQEGTPDLVSMENVQGLAKHDSFLDLLSVLGDLNYDVDFGVLNFYKYGVPQRRWRLVMIASRRGQARLPEPTGHIKNVADFIRDMSPIFAGETSSTDPAHSSLPLSPTNLSRIRQSKPGGSWKDWDEDLVSSCHTRAFYPAPYGRMQWDQPAPTITTQFCYYSTGRFGHPTQDRTVSVREAALLQTFPLNYKLVDPHADMPIRQLARHVGNAVPVKIGEHIGISLKRAASNV